MASLQQVAARIDGMEEAVVRKEVGGLVRGEGGEEHLHPSSCIAARRQEQVAVAASSSSFASAVASSFAARSHYNLHNVLVAAASDTSSLDPFDPSAFVASAAFAYDTAAAHPSVVAGNHILTVRDWHY